MLTNNIMGLEALVMRAKNVNYVSKTDKTEWDYIHESIWISLHNDVQCKTLFILCEMFSPIKFITRMLIKKYIEANA